MTRREKTNLLLNLLLVGAILGAGVLVVKVLLPASLPLVLGLVLAALIHPLTKALMGRAGLGGKPAALFACLLFYLGVGTVLWVIGWLLCTQAADLFARMPGLWQQVAQPLDGQLFSGLTKLLGTLAPDATSQAAHLVGTISSAAEGLVASACASALELLTGLAGKLPLIGLTVLFTLLSSVIISLDYNRVTAFFVRQLPRRVGEALLDSKHFLMGSLLRLVRAYFLIMLITFGELALGFWLLRVPYFFAIAAATAVLDILPVLGSGAVLLPWALVELLRGNLPMAAGLAILWGIIGLVRNIIEPKIVGDQLGLHPLATITAMFLGLKLAGFGGMIAGPLTVLLARFLTESGYVRLYR